MITLRRLASGLLILGLCACGQAELYRVPDQTGDGWRTASLAEQAIEPAPILEMLERTRAGEYDGRALHPGR